MAPSLADCVTLLNTSKCQFPPLKAEIATVLSLSIVEDSHLAQGLIYSSHSVSVSYHISMANLAHCTGELSNYLLGA